MSIADLGSQDVNINGITFPSGTLFNQYNAIPLTGTVSGPFAAPVAVTGLYRRIGSTVTFSLNAINAAATSTNFMTYSFLLPDTPAFPFNIPIYITTGVTTILGNCQIIGSGAVQIFNGYAGTFPSGVVAGFPAFAATYTIA